MAEDERISVALKDGSAVLTINGDFTPASEKRFRQAFDEIPAVGIGSIVLVFKNDSYINSGGIALLIQTLAKTRKNSQKVAIAGVSEHFKKVFGMVGITRFAALYDTEQTAVEALAGG